MTTPTIIHVISDAWGPFVDVRAMLESLSRRSPSTRVIAPAELEAVMKSEIWFDPAALIVLWEMIDPGPKSQRRCKVAHVYFEAMDEELDRLLPAHRVHWHVFKDRIVHYDAVFTHTPWTAEFVRKHTQAEHVFVMPLGWDAEAMGRPRWNAPKFNLVAYHGSPTGRRDLVVPFLQQRLAPGFVDVSGSFGRGLLGHLDTAKSSLYIAHSDVRSFSTWRLWQAASTSCAMIVEGDHELDTWPFGSDCYVRIPWITMATAADAATEIARIVKWVDLEAPARRAHAVAAAYPIDRVQADVVIPAWEKLQQ